MNHKQAQQLTGRKHGCTQQCPSCCTTKRGHIRISQLYVDDDDLTNIIFSLDIGQIDSAPLVRNVLIPERHRIRQDDGNSDKEHHDERDVPANTTAAGASSWHDEIVSVIQWCTNKLDHQNVSKLSLALQLFLMQFLIDSVIIKKSIQR